MDSPQPIPPAEPVKKKLPRWALVAILIVGGIVLAVGGCGFFLTNMNSTRTETLSILGGIAFIVGLLMFAVGGLTALVFGAQRLFSKRENN